MKDQSFLSIGIHLKLFIVYLILMINSLSKIQNKLKNSSLTVSVILCFSNGELLKFFRDYGPQCSPLYWLNTPALNVTTKSTVTAA